MASNELTGDASHDSGGGRDERLERLVAMYLGGLNDGERLDRARILAEQPELGEEVLRDLEMFVDLRTGVDDNGPLGTLGDYTLRRQIGRGGMGVVYEAWQNSVDRQVALKVLPSGVAADNRTFLRFMREAKTAAQLNHQNIVSVYAMGVDDKTPYYAMELVEGETLAQIVARLSDAGPNAETPFGATRNDQEFYIRIAGVFADAADALQHAHSRGVVHRDIKPSNLILDRGADRGADREADRESDRRGRANGRAHGRLRILDFGLARLEGQESLTASGDVVGTPLYMSPEQARQRKIQVDHRTDIYSLGATMYEMLTWRPPFQGEDHQGTLSQIIECDPVEPRKLNPRVPRDLETIVLKCLRKEPRDRYGTAEALGQDLRRFVRGDPVEARPQGRWEKVQRRVWRYRGRIAVAALIAALLAAVGHSLMRYRADLYVEEERAYREKVEQAVMDLYLGLQGGQFTRGHSELMRWLSRLLHSGLPTSPASRRADPVERAFGILDEAAEIVPERPDAFYHRGRGLLILGDKDAAVEYLRRAVERDPEFVPAWTLLRAATGRPPNEAATERSARSSRDASRSWVDAWNLAHQSVLEGRWGDAARAYKELRLRETSRARPYAGCSVETSLGLGTALFESREYDAAIRELAVATYRWPEAPAPALLLAQTYLWHDRTAAADQIFNELFERSEDYKDEVALEVAIIIATRHCGLLPDEPALDWVRKVEDDFLRERALAYFLVWAVLPDRSQKAIEAARKALQLCPDDPVTNALLASAHATGPGESATTDRYARRVLDRAADSRDVSMILGDAYFKLRQFDRARDMYRKGPRGLSVLMLGEVAERCGGWGEAIRYYSEFLGQYPNSFYAATQLGFALVQKGDIEQGLDYIERAIDLHPAHPAPYVGRGRALLLREDWDNAEGCFRKAAELCPTDWFTYKCLAELEEGRGRIDEAIAHCRRSLEIKPDYWIAHETLARLVRAYASGSQDPTSDITELDEVVRLLEANVKAGEGSPRLYNTLALARMHAPGLKDLNRALEYAKRAVAETAGEDQDFRVTLSEIEAVLSSEGR